MEKRRWKKKMEKEDGKRRWKKKSDSAVS